MPDAARGGGCWWEINPTHSPHATILASGIGQRKSQELCKCDFRKRAFRVRASSYVRLFSGKWPKMA
eukprot:scaffold1050_cov176-Ochromonas_danica.AAC.7